MIAEKNVGRALRAPWESNMPFEGSLTVQPDGSLAVPKHPGEDTTALDATLSGFAEPASALICARASSPITRWKSRTIIG